MINFDTFSTIKKSLSFEVVVSDRLIVFAEWALILAFCLTPTLITFPFRINLFLAWEGAYRLSEGQFPFVDFGMPLGFGFWIIPALCFKLFGPQMITLVKAQAIINFLTLISFRSILKILDSGSAIRLIALLVMGLTYILVNFWPWYNNTVYVYELIAIYFLLLACYKLEGAKSIISVAVAAFFVVLAIFTKQDGGGMALVLVSGVVLIYSLLRNRWKLLSTFSITLSLWLLIFVLPFISYDIGYWFNYGQFPHYSRINLYDFLNDIFGRSFQIKLYISLLILVSIASLKRFKGVEKELAVVMFYISFGMLGQALLIQVTSYIPHNVNIYYHSFGVASLLYISRKKINWRKAYILFTALILTILCFSSDYWLYANRIFGKLLANSDNEVISKNTWSRNENDPTSNRSVWVESEYWVFEDIYLPKETIEGIASIENMNVVQQKRENLKVLNMSELTPLIKIIGYDSERGSHFPLWFHYGVSMFDREVSMLCNNINKQKYDIVLFEVIPDLNNFFPSQVKDCLRKNYKLANQFLAPRTKQNAHIEVYIKQ